MQFEIENEAYEYDGKLTVGDATLLYEKCALGINQIDAALNAGHPVAIAAWMFMLMRRAKVAVTWDALQKMDIRSFRAIPDPPKETEEGENENPPEAKTGRTGKTPKSASGSTS